MKELNIEIAVKIYDYEELDAADRELMDAAREATNRSYAPYSHFSVGAAARLANGIVVTGTNQEHAAYPSEHNEFLESPIPPCGACRQVMLETEKRFKHPMRVLLYGKKGIYELKNVGELLPLSFDASAMK